MSAQMEAIIAAFAEVSQWTAGDLTGHYGNSALRRQRKVLWLLIRDMTPATHGQMGARFGGRDASTISEAVALLRGEAAVLQHTAREIEDWRLRVERRLRDLHPRGAMRLVRQASARGQPTVAEFEGLVATLVSVDALLRAPGLGDETRLSGLRALMDRETGGEAAA